ncbi:MAG: hypothetical protein HY550_05115 [Elusimicrobia bacterium]|nr:hypothetical protein [Elusimicrobiota bacterium]
MARYFLSCIRTFVFTLVVVILSCLSGHGLLLAAEVGQKVAVLDFKTVGDSTDLGEEAAETLRTYLLETGKYTVIKRGMINKALKKQRPGLSGEIDQATAIGVGKVLGVQLVAVGSVVKKDELYTLTVRFDAVATGEMIFRKKLATENREDISDLCGRMVKLLTKKDAPQVEGKQSAAGNWALGGIYPGAALKYVTGGKSAWELRAQSGSGVLALGPRYYRYLSKNANPRLFLGIEADYITFKGEVSKGTGFAGGAFAGGEIFLTKQIGLLMDFGPMYIHLADSNFSESASGIEYVLNMGIYWHFE